MEFNTKNYFTISVDEILKRVSEQDIFKYYIKGYDGTTKKFCSEIRRDSLPTVGIKVMPSGKYIYKDFGTGDTFTVFDYVQIKYGIDFYSTLKLIVKDLGLMDLKFEKPKTKDLSIVSNISSESHSNVQMRIVPIEFTQKGLNYWSEYNINKELLERYKVKQISHYYLNDLLITIPKKELAFSYSFGNNKVGRYKYKILRVANANWKWVSNCNSNILQGFDQLPDKADLLFLTSSLKDCMSLRSLGYMATASQSENTTISNKLITELKKRFNRVVLFLNNDLAGLKAAEYQSKLYGVPFVHFCICQPKDPSDFIKSEGVDETIKMISKMVSNIR